MKFYIRLVSAILILGFSQTQGKAQAKNTPSYLYKIGIADSIYSEILEEQRYLWIKYPKYYDPEIVKSYPVVYVLDGETQLRALETVCTYYEGHFMPDMILVGISNSDHRMRDLTTSEITLRHGWPVKEESGGAENFTRFIESELIPYIDAKLPTTTYRTLIGHSFGGLFAINTFLKHTHLFTNYIAIDPSLDWDEQKLLNEFKSIIQSKDFTGTSLFVSLSATSLHMQNEAITMENVMMDTSDYSLFARSIIEFSEVIKSQNPDGFNFSWQHYPDDLHATVSLPTIRDGLIFTFEWYQLESFWKYNDFDTPTKELLDLIEYRAKKLKDHFGYAIPPLEEELFYMMGYMALESGQPEKSFSFFDMGIKYFPESPNAYDSMADYYEAQNDPANALIYVQKAYELSGDEYHKNRIEELK